LTSHVDVGTRPVQSSHEAPFWPHCVSTKPAWQTSLWSQHPVQLLASHFGGAATHAFLLQVPPAVSQLVHAWPPVPQNVLRLPGRQFVPSQHPLGQVEGSQTGGGDWQRPALHVPPPGVAVQSLQKPPATPHSLAVVPGWQLPLKSQHPSQFVESQKLFVSQKPPKPPWATQNPPTEVQSAQD
jgi:hypothetical protein